MRTRRSRARWSWRREDRPGDVRLVAYVVAAGTTGAIDARAQLARLRQTLPGYMVPQHLVVLAALPLLPNGKVDRKALPVPALDAFAAEETGADNPASPELAYLLALCARLIGAPVRGRDNFFDAGGHSLLAAKLMSTVRRETGCSLNMLGLASQTLEQVAAGLTIPPVAGAPAPAPAPIAERRRGGVFRQLKAWLRRGRT